MIRDHTFEGVLLDSDHFRNGDLKNCAVHVSRGGWLETSNLVRCLVYCGSDSKILNNGFENCIVVYEKTLAKFGWLDALKMVCGGPKPSIELTQTVMNNRFVNSVGKP